MCSTQREWTQQRPVGAAPRRPGLLHTFACCRADRTLTPTLFCCPRTRVRPPAFKTRGRAGAGVAYALLPLCGFSKRIPVSSVQDLSDPTARPCPLGHHASLPGGTLSFHVWDVVL